jgi:hypothetical protein
MFNRWYSVHYPCRKGGEFILTSVHFFLADSSLVESASDYMERCKEAYDGMFVHLPGGAKCKDLDKKKEALKVQLEWNEKLNRELTLLDDELPKDLSRLVKLLSDLVGTAIQWTVRQPRLTDV